MKVGVGLPVGNHRGTPPAPYAAIRSMALQAEAIGLDSVWVYDHLLFRMPDLPDSGAHEGWSILAAVAAITERVDVGMLVTGLRLRNPGLVAKMAATVDEISDGHLILGVGAGWHDPELEAFGYPTDNRIGRFEEALEVLLPLIRNGKADFDGRWATARNAVMLPPARPKIPILIAARGPRMLRLTARHADMSNLAWFASADDALLAQRTAALDEACLAEGRDPVTLVRTCWRLHPPAGRHDPESGAGPGGAAADHGRSREGAARFRRGRLRACDRLVGPDPRGLPRTPRRGGRSAGCLCRLRMRGTLHRVSRIYWS
jgi:alkanesulfonate monooxygenase SsuD/methylene tetrahydromethanopterin reductase-like flavin-dependent oxidoreductase (luciferase family)